MIPSTEQTRLECEVKAMLGEIETAYAGVHKVTWKTTSNGQRRFSFKLDAHEDRDKFYKTRLKDVIAQRKEIDKELKNMEKERKNAEKEAQKARKAAEKAEKDALKAAKAQLKAKKVEVLENAAI